MPPYAARADLADRYGVDELDDLAPVGAGGASRADEALADASAEIDAILAAEYRVPLGAGPWPALAGPCCDLARERLHDDGAPKAVRRSAEQARASVRALATSDAALVDAAGAEAPRRVQPSFDGAAPIFRRRR